MFVEGCRNIQCGCGSGGLDSHYSSCLQSRICTGLPRSGERLQDQVLEYDEIADLIHEYNVTVQNNQYEYHQFIKDYGTTKDDVSEAYLDLADELEASMTGEDGMAMVSDFQLEQQAKRLREQADDNLEDSRIYYLTYCQAEDSLVLSAQSKFLSYYKSQLELEAAKEQKQLLENSCELIRLQYQARSGTQSEVLEAEEPFRIRKYLSLSWNAKSRTPDRR